MEQPKIALCVRRSLHYFHDDLQLTEFWWWNGREKFRNTIKGWNLFFGMNFIEFRHRLSYIAAQTYLPNRFDHILFWEDWDVIKELDENTWLVPIDEDDWIGPHLVDELKEAIPKAEDFIEWDAVTIDCDGSSKIKHFRAVLSCAYALKMPCEQPYITHHANTLDGKFKRVVHKLDKCLAVKLENISSVTQLGDGIDLTIRAVQNMSLIQPSDLLTDYQPYIEQYNNLLKELRDSCRVKMG